MKKVLCVLCSIVLISGLVYFAANNFGKLSTDEQCIAGRGCCSSHGGVCGCYNGRSRCCDGSLSPSCHCFKDDIEGLSN